MTTDPTNTDLELDEAYDSAEDEDFELDAAVQDESEVSSSEGEGEVSGVQPAKKKRKTAPRGKKDTKGKEEDELDSGDEVTIQKAKERKGRKSKGKAGDEDDEDVDFDDDEGGTGGFVRTRAMKMRTQEERKPLAKVDGATVDVNALWEKMNTSESGTVPLPTQTETTETTETTEPPAQDKTEPEKPPAPKEPRKQVKFSEEMIKIKRTYKFAGEMITEEKTVPKDSAEAKIFLSSGENVDTVDSADAATNSSAGLRRPLRKVSRFDPNPTGSIKKSWEKQPTESGVGETAKGPKINTVEKSRLDWAQYVDQAGIKDELTVHSKAKEGYMGRMDFLGRVDAKREEERRNARLKGM